MNPSKPIRQPPNRIIAHAADIGIRVFGRSKKALFINCARAMCGLIAQRKHKSGPSPLCPHKFLVRITADNLEELLIGWLNALLSLMDIQRVLLSRFEINACTNTAITASVQGARLAKRDFQIKHEIKAATYHQLKIRPHRCGLMAEVFFDL